MKIRFDHADVECEAKVGQYLVDITDENPLSAIPYACRAANCGSCRVEVLEGGEAFAEPDDDELEVLEIFGDPPSVRLCCQLKLAAEVDRVVLTVID